MNTPAQNFKKLVSKHGISSVSEAIELLIKQQQPAYISGKVIPVITEIFKVSKEDLLSPKDAETRNARKLLIYITTKYLNVSQKQLAEYFILSPRTVRRHCEFIKNTTCASANTAEARIHKKFREKAINVINNIEKRKYESSNF